MASQQKMEGTNKANGQNYTMYSNPLILSDSIFTHIIEGDADAKTKVPTSQMTFPKPHDYVTEVCFESRISGSRASPRYDISLSAVILKIIKHQEEKQKLL